MALALWAAPAAAQGLRIATFNAELSRDGPGVLLNDIREGDPQVQAVVQVIVRARPDVLLLQGFDYDLHGRAMGALAARLDNAGVSYPYQFAALPNSGLRTGVDMDGDGFADGPRDAQGYGRFTGHGGLAVLSRYPLVTEEVRDFTPMLWRDLPGARLPQVDGVPFPSAEVQAIQRLSSVAHWDVPVQTPQGPLHLWAFHATPPVFDGPEDRNGLRNRDELRLWQVYLDGGLGTAPPEHFVLLGGANIDPTKGQGRPDTIRALLNDPRLTDPQPGKPTVEWPGIGAMRVDYVLPSSTLRVLDAGIVSGQPDGVGEQASRHHLVWVEVALP